MAPSSSALTRHSFFPDNPHPFNIMKNLTLPLTLLVLVGLTAPMSAQYSTLAAETFEYTAGPLGDHAGGTGWSSDWWSGVTLDDAVVASPGLDMVGNKATTNLEHVGSYRTLDTSAFPGLTVNDKYGKDNTTIWIAFDCVRESISDDFYGGLSLFEQWGGERLFIGSPYGQDWWGVDLSFVLTPTWVPNTDCGLQARLVVRIDFLPGDDRVRMWVSPGDDHPVTVADLDTVFPDFTFNEIRLQSGSGGAATAFSFDGIMISADTTGLGPSYQINNLVAGQTASLEVQNMTPGSNVIFAYSVSGPGPTPTPFGPVAMSMPINQMPPMAIGGSGALALPVNVPAGIAGVTIYTQAAELFAGGGGLLTNALAPTVQ